ncbi:MAG: hypothetical protein AUI19_04205 [Myxococcales bacterium 13_1_40CM_2_68_15]|nr:MAG: hypothetical protein AUI19_04205 [Myxococcales bacterium 13_1_40CM_2_68_15]
MRGADLQDAKAATARPALIPAHPDRPPRRMRAAYHIPQGWTSGPPLGKLRGDEAGMTTEQTMTTEHIHFGDSTRQAALFETMILAAAADGSVDKVELQEIYRRVFERPEFHGIQADDLRAAIEHAARRVGEAQSLEHILPSIVDRLPDKASRELAFGLAASVIVADGRTPLAELNILKALQDMFDLSEEDVARLFETAQSHGEFPPTKGK